MKFKNFGKSIERFMELNEKRVEKVFLGDKSLENGLGLGSFKEAPEQEASQGFWLFFKLP